MDSDPRESHDRSACDISPVWQDGPKRPIQRPPDPEEQEDDDRGKKKRHTLKNLLVSNEGGQVCFLSPTGAGKASDLSVAEMAG